MKRADQIEAAESPPEVILPLDDTEELQEHFKIYHHD
jgi:hypothetical protein